VVSGSPVQWSVFVVDLDPAVGRSSRGGGQCWSSRGRCERRAAGGGGAAIDLSPEGAAGLSNEALVPAGCWSRSRLGGDGRTRSVRSSKRRLGARLGTVEDQELRVAVRAAVRVQLDLGRLDLLRTRFTFFRDAFMLASSLWGRSLEAAASAADSLGGLPPGDRLGGLLPSGLDGGLCRANSRRSSFRRLDGGLLRASLHNGLLPGGLLARSSVRALSSSRWIQSVCSIPRQGYATGRASHDSCTFSGKGACRMRLRVI